MTVEESDSDSDDELEGGVRHDLMMADEKVPAYRRMQFITKRNQIISKTYKSSNNNLTLFYIISIIYIIY